MSFRTRALAAVCAACVASSGFYFSTRSKDNLNEVHPKLQELAKCALNVSPVDFVVVDGLRTEAEHQENLRKGVSWIKRSRHQDGCAIDVAAYHQGQVSYEPDLYYKISGSFYFCSQKMDIPIISGGEWRVKDYMHIELTREVCP